jgi:sugar phosphate isomerase/epimerase
VKTPTLIYSDYASTLVTTSLVAEIRWTQCELMGRGFATLHLKDVQVSVLEAARRDGVGFLEAVRRGVFCELGEGAINLKKIIQYMTAGGYADWAIVEQDVDTRSSDVRPIESARRSREFLRSEIGI